MAKKVFLHDQNETKLLPITRGELVLDSSGEEAFHSSEFLANNSQPGLMSAADKIKLDILSNIPCVIGKDSDSKSKWTGESDAITQYVDGLSIIYVPKVAGTVSKLTLQINELPAKSILISENDYTSADIAAGSPLLLTYSSDSDKWVTTDCNQAFDIPNHVWICEDINKTKIIARGTYAVSPNSYVPIIMPGANSQTSVSMRFFGTSSTFYPVYLNGKPVSEANYGIPKGFYLVYFDGSYVHLNTNGILPGKIDKSVIAEKVQLNIVEGGGPGVDPDYETAETLCTSLTLTKGKQAVTDTVDVIKADTIRASGDGSSLYGTYSYANVPTTSYVQSNYKPKQTPVQDGDCTTSNSPSMQFVNKVEQDADGVISVSKKEITAADLGLSKVMQYIGKTTTAIAAHSTNGTVKIGADDVTVKAGDVVISESGVEYIWNGTYWEEFGNEGGYKVVQTYVGSPSSTGAATEFIDTISQDTQGKITATKKYIPKASYDTYGIIQVGDNLETDGNGVLSAIGYTYTGDRSFIEGDLAEYFSKMYSHIEGQHVDLTSTENYSMVLNKAPYDKFNIKFTDATAFVLREILELDADVLQNNLYIADGFDGMIGLVGMYPSYGILVGILNLSGYGTVTHDATGDSYQCIVFHLNTQDIDQNVEVSPVILTFNQIPSDYLGDNFTFNNTHSVAYILSHAEGLNGAAFGVGHSEGIGTNSMMVSHAEGSATTALNYSHSEGMNTHSDYISHAEGFKSSAIHLSHAEGISTQAYNMSHAEGGLTLSSGQFSHAEGYDTKALGESSHSEGYVTESSGDYSHSEGELSIAIGEASHAEGCETLSYGKYSHAEGHGNIIDDRYVYVATLGSNNTYTITSGTDYQYLHVGMCLEYDGKYYAVSEVQKSESAVTINLDKACDAQASQSNPIEFKLVIGVAYGSQSHVEGQNNTATGVHSHAEGNTTRAFGESSHTEGRETNALSTSSHAEGNNTIASGYASHAEGHLTKAENSYAHSEGSFTIASGSSSHTEGHRTQAKNSFEHAQGCYNKSNTSTDYRYQTISSIGIGNYTGSDPYDDSKANRKNAFEVMVSGDVYLVGVGGYDGTNPTTATTLQTVINNLNGSSGDIPSVGNGTVIINQEGTQVGSFTLNQSGNTTINLTDTKYSHPATHAASMITGLATVATSGSYNDLSNKPTIPTTLKNPNSISFKNASNTNVSYDGSSAVDLTGGIYYAKNADNIKTAKKVTTTNYSVLFSSNTAGNSEPYISDYLRFKPSDASETKGLLSVTGKIKASDGFYQESDERLKDFQDDVQVDLEQLSKLPKKTFTWKNDGTKENHIGTSAQEVQKLYPELVKEDSDGTLSVAYDKLSIIALKAIDELYKRNIELEKRIKELENK